MTDTWLSFTAENKHEIPSDFRDHTHIEYLYINDCGLTQLPEGLAECHALHSVVLSENQLESLPEGVFSNENMPRLERLDLSYNRLRGLPAAIWQLESLVYLDIQGNPLESLGERIHLPNLQTWFVEEIEADMMPDDCYLPSLESLEWRGWLDNTTLPDGFRQSHRLREIRIYESALRQIETLSQLPDLQVIVITNARLCEFPQLPASMEKIDLSQNPIQKIPSHIGKLKALKSLYLNGHRLQEVPAEFGELVALEALELMGEPIQRFPVCFSQQTRLHYLRLRLAPHAVLGASFTQLPALKNLKIEGGTLATTAVWYLPSLETMHWEHCRLDHRVFATKEAFPRLNKLIIEHWQVVDGVVDFSALSALKTLHLSHTTLQIGNLPEGLESFTYWYSRTFMQKWLKLPNNIYTLSSLKKIVLHKNALPPEEEERLQRHCAQKGIALEWYSAAKITIYDVLLWLIPAKQNELLQQLTTELPGSFSSIHSMIETTDEGRWDFEDYSVAWKKESFNKHLVILALGLKSDALTPKIKLFLDDIMEKEMVMGVRKPAYNLIDWTGDVQAQLKALS